jgi:hypothetical protein
MHVFLLYHERRRINEKHNSLHDHVLRSFFWQVTRTRFAETRYTGCLSSSACFEVLEEAGPLLVAT